MKIKSCILLLLVLIFMSACEVQLPKLNVPQIEIPQQCCIVSDNAGNVIGCSYLESNNAECNAHYFSLGNTAFMSEFCTEAMCPGLTHNCLGYDTTLGAYIIQNEEKRCMHSKLYNCDNGFLNLINENGCCYDSDNGLNYYEKGITDIPKVMTNCNHNMLVEKSTEQCDDGNFVSEDGCENDCTLTKGTKFTDYFTNSLPCNNVCSSLGLTCKQVYAKISSRDQLVGVGSNACSFSIPQSVRTCLCYNSTAIIPPKEDYCLDRNTLREYSCSNNEISYTDSTCDYRCRNGICVESPLCYELIPNHNDRLSNRINIIFINVGFDNIEIFKEKIELITDFYSINQLNGNGYDNGIFGIEPFKSNKDQFNIWYDSEKMVDVDNEAHFLNEIFLFNETYNLNNVERIFVVNNKDYSGPNFVQGGPTGTIASSEGQFFTSTALHEFLHTAMKIGDEYGYAGIYITENGYPANWKVTYPPITVPDDFNVTHIFEQCYYTPNIVRIISNISNEEGVIQSYYDQYSLTSQGIIDCENNAPWRDLIGNGCGNDGVIDCNFENPDWQYEVNCNLSFAGLPTDLACHGFGNLVRAIPESIMRMQTKTKLGPFLERLVCLNIRSKTGSVSGICNQLCIDSCTNGKKCIEGTCV